MLGRVKKWFGIEGVKIDLEIPYEFDKNSEVIEGAVLLTSIKEQTIHQITLSLIETYKRGRGDSKRIDDYVIGEKIYDVSLIVKKDDVVRFPFSLIYTMPVSEMDKYEENIFLKPMVSLAKWTKGVKSRYKIKASAHVKGTKFNAFIEKPLNFKN